MSKSQNAHLFIYSSYNWSRNQNPKKLWLASVFTPGKWEKLNNDLKPVHEYGIRREEIN